MSRKILSLLMIVMIGLGTSLSSTSARVNDAGEFAESYDIYQHGDRSQDLIDRYGQYIEGAQLIPEAWYFEAAVSFAMRIADSRALPAQLKADLLPMWPEYNMTTYGHITAYLFPHKRKPLEYAKQKGFVKDEARFGEFMSRGELMFLYIRMLSPRGELLTIRDLKQAGIISNVKVWSDTEYKGGFPLVEAISIVLEARHQAAVNLHGAAERKQQSRTMVSLKKDRLGIDHGSVKLLLATLFNQGQYSSQELLLLERVLVDFWANGARKILTSGHITGMITALNTLLPQGSIPNVPQLPEHIELQDCHNAQAETQAWEGLVRTGIRGTSIHCGKMILSLPAQSYLFNIFPLPQVGTDLGENSMAAYFEAENPFANTVIIGPEGEEGVRVSIAVPEQNIGEEYQLQLRNEAGETIVTERQRYQVFKGTTFANMLIHPRKLPQRFFALFVSSL